MDLYVFIALIVSIHLASTKISLTDSILGGIFWPSLLSDIIVDKINKTEEENNKLKK